MAGKVLCPQRPLLEPLLSGRMLPSGAHAGLVFDRYLRIWDEDEFPTRTGGKPQLQVMRLRERELQEALREFIRNFDAARTTQEAALKASHARWQRLEQSKQGQVEMLSAVFELKSRLALGVGAEHPLENNLSFEPVLGVPYIPGSAVKGLLRAQASALGLPETQLLRLFGPEEIDGDVQSEDNGGSSARIGDLRCYPALPLQWPSLELELINNHHPGYYGDERLEQKRTVPNGTESPVPVFLLMVKPGSTAQFRFRLGSRSGDREALELGMELLRVGLQLQGLGSKTEVGYGRFSPVSLPEYRSNVRKDAGGDPVVIFEAMIGDIPGRILPSAVAEAIAPSAIRQEFRLNMLSSVKISDVHAYQWAVVEKLEGLRQEVLDWTLKQDFSKLHVFAFGPIPLLMKLGERLGDKVPMQLYQRHSDSEDWRWKAPPTPLGISVDGPGEQYQNKHVVVLLNISGENLPSDAREAVRRTWGEQLPELEVYRVKVPVPARNIVTHPEQIQEYRQAFRQVIEKVQARHGVAVRVHLFPALPIPFAIETGRCLIGSDPALYVYERRREREGWVYALKLTENGPDSPDKLRVRKVVVLAPSPADATPVEQNNELRELMDAQQRGEARDRFRVIERAGATIDTLRESLLLHRPAVLHIASHAMQDKGVVFQTSEGGSAPISPESLAELLKLAQPRLECVVLNACSTLKSAEAIRPFVDCVVGTTRPISSEAAREFSRGFYRALFNGGTYSQAFEHGRVEVAHKSAEDAALFSFLG